MEEIEFSRWFIEDFLLFKLSGNNNCRVSFQYMPLLTNLFKVHKTFDCYTVLLDINPLKAAQKNL